MNIKKILFASLIVFGLQNTTAQTDLEQIQTTLNLYINGTANGNPNDVKKAFHKDLNLYFIKNDSLKAWPGKKYIKNIKDGVKANRVGKIVSVNVVNKIAHAIVEIDMPDRKRRFTDFMLLSKIDNEWKIVHKAFTSEKY